MLTSMTLASMWSTIINAFAGWIVNYGWAIIVFTIVLKLILSPLDILQRVSSQKQARVMGAMQPELDEIKKKYANNPEKMNAEQNKLYQKYNSNLKGVCLPMLISLIVTLVVFFTLYSSIRSLGNEKLYETYRSLDTTYVEASANVEESWSEDEKNEYIALAVQEKYDEQSRENSWLWVKNVWKADTNTSQFVDFEDYWNYLESNELTASSTKEEAQARHEFIVNTIVGDSSDNNGYFILIILCALVSFLSQFISTKLLNSKGQKINTMNKVMMAIIPISMLIFAYTSNVVFTLYIITNSLMTTIISTIISLIMRRMNKGKTDKEIILKKKNVEIMEYSRNYKK